MTELSFLINLLLNDKLPAEIKLTVAERIKEVEMKLQAPSYFAPIQAPTHYIPARTAQAPSTQKILDQMSGDSHSPYPAAQEFVAPTPPEATTLAAAQALASRNNAIQQAVSGRQDPGRKSPRKF